MADTYSPPAGASAAVEFPQATADGGVISHVAIRDAVTSGNMLFHTALEIRNFEGNSQKALREARLPAKERTLRASSRAARDDLDYAFDLLSDSD